MRVAPLVQHDVIAQYQPTRSNDKYSFPIHFVASKLFKCAYQYSIYTTGHVIRLIVFYNFL
jgi:hypothetical protein